MDPVKRAAAALVGLAAAGYIVWLVAFAPDGMFFSRKGVFALLPVLPIVLAVVMLLAKPTAPESDGEKPTSESPRDQDADFDF